MLGCLLAIEQSFDIIGVSAMKNVHTEVQQLAGVPNALCCLQFVAGEYPDFNVCLVKSLDGTLDVFLKAILEDGGSEQAEISLPLVIDLL